MKILLIGSEGFIGSNLRKYLNSRGYEVQCADILDKQRDGYYKLVGSVTDYPSLFSSYNADVCINASGSANVQYSFSAPEEDYLLNVSNVFNMLDALRKHAPNCKFINFSSAAVYGSPVKLPIHEDDPLQPVSPYGWHKLYSEQLCTEFQIHFGIGTKSLRIFSAYGEGQRKLLFWDLFNKVLNSKSGKISLFGTGDESRDFIHISDLVRAIESVIVNGQFDGKAINIASGREYTIREAVEIFLSFFSNTSEVQFTGNKKIGDPQNWRADVMQLRALGFRTSVDLVEGLRKYLDWLQEKK